MRIWSTGSTRSARAHKAVGVALGAALVFALSASTFVIAAAAAAGERPEIAGYRFFFGNLHAHTGYSDGLELPEDAFRTARDVAGMDFMAVTDHDYMMLEIPAHWEDLKRTAARFTEDGRFVALSGAEWTENTSGHINLFSDGAMITRDTHPDPAALYRWLEGGEAWLAQFNHPNPDFQRNWDDFAYDWNANRTIRLLEVGNGYWTHNLRYEASYVRALDRGWYVSAVSNQDNHSANWGIEGDSRTGVVAPALTKADLATALRENRTYATEDRNVAVYFAARDSGSVMLGGHLDYDGRPVRLSWRIVDPDPGDDVAQVEVVTNGGRVAGKVAGHAGAGVVAGADAGGLDVTPEIGYNWYYLRIWQKDGDLVVTAPVWVEDSSRLSVVDLAVANSVVRVGRPVGIKGTLINHSDRGFAGVEVRFAVAGGGEPFARLKLDVPAGATIPLDVNWVPQAAGKQAVVATVISPASGSASAAGFVGDAGSAGMGSAPNRYFLRVEVRPADLPRVLIDEGHNNRFTGLSGRFRALLADSGWDAAVNEGSLSEATLSGYHAVVIGTPEDGLSLLPNTFTDEEIQALVKYVVGGGALVLAGGGPELTQEGVTFPELNRLLEELGSSLRLDDAGLVSAAGGGARGGAGAATGTASGTAPSTASGATSGTASRGPRVLLGTLDDLADFDIANFAAMALGANATVVPGQAVFAAYEMIGQAGGRVIVLSTPLYSDYDLQGRSGKAAFLRWLFARSALGAD